MEIIPMHNIVLPFVCKVLWRDAWKSDSVTSTATQRPSKVRGASDVIADTQRMFNNS
jgi:hypothetical protein